MVEYDCCCLDANLTGKSMAMKSLRKINTNLQFLDRQNEFLNPKLRRLLGNSLIQPHLTIIVFPIIVLPSSQPEIEKENTG